VLMRSRGFRLPVVVKDPWRLTPPEKDCCSVPMEGDGDRPVKGVAGRSKSWWVGMQSCSPSEELSGERRDLSCMVGESGAEVGRGDAGRE